MVGLTEKEKVILKTLESEWGNGNLGYPFSDKKYHRMRRLQVKRVGGS